ncbi:MAG: UvrD-helicase domain-containing protein, partial [Salinisphaera sp.]|nr:UvrD-helicase domain-containing protein [Salinisphaera sp.]
MTLSGRADDYQREAIAIEGHGLVSACPGAGKTRVLALRSGRLLQGNPQGNLVAVTFTRDAAQSLRQRILAEAGSKFSRRLAAGTFHALALNQFRRQRGSKAPRLISTREQYVLMSQAFSIAREEANFRFDQLRDGIEAIESIKASMADPPDPRYSPAGALYAIYQR